MSFFGRLNASIQLIKESWRILKKDKELLLYPFVSAVISIVLLFAIFVPVIFAGFSTFNFWIAFIVFYFLAVIVGTFFTAGLMASANIRLNGKDPKFSDGLKVAAKNFPRLLGWAILNATVGIILRTIAEGDNIIAKIVSYILAFAWSMLTLFTIPVILFEKKGVFGSIKRSGEIFKHTWGESVVGQFSIGALFVLGFLAGLFLIFLAYLSGIFSLFAIVFVLVFILWVILYLITSALDGIYKTALYNYATKKKLPKGFSKEFIQNAFAEKKKISRGFV
ncbi:MAG: hypothetical protein HY831_02585 [Candidatus Aenigmarchaeota archaeon]|nr:hypothetical protein [Candidatus Aenigmarchaeota archaeon]